LNKTHLFDIVPALGNPVPYGPGYFNPNDLNFIQSELLKHSYTDSEKDDLWFIRTRVKEDSIFKLDVFEKDNLIRNEKELPLRIERDKNSQNAENFMIAHQNAIKTFFFVEIWFSSMVILSKTYSIVKYLIINH